MIYQMPCPSQDTLFVASTLHEEGLAECEISQWATAHGYQPLRDPRTFVFYPDGARAREWRIIRRNHAASGTGH